MYPYIHAHRQTYTHVYALLGEHPNTHTHTGLIKSLPSKSRTDMGAHIKLYVHPPRYTCVYASHKIINVFEHIHTAHSHIRVYICTVTDPLAGSNTHACAPEQQSYSAPPLVSSLCTKPGVHILSKGHCKFALALFLASLPLLHLESCAYYQ